MRAPTSIAADEEIVRCGYCPKMVAFRPTSINGHALCFEVALIDRRKDTNREGWLPAPRSIGGHMRTVWTPWAQVSPATRQGRRHVAMLHQCSGQTRAASEDYYPGVRDGQTRISHTLLRHAG